MIIMCKIFYILFILSFSQIVHDSHALFYTRQVASILDRMVLVFIELLLAGLINRLSYLVCNLLVDISFKCILKNKDHGRIDKIVYIYSCPLIKR